MEVGGTKKLFIDSKTLKHLFDFDIKVGSSKDSFALKLVNAAVHFEEVIGKIKNLTRTLELKKFSDEAKDLEVGTVCVFEVDVACARDSLNVSETIASNRNRFFQLNPQKITRVIWVRSKSIRMVEAKLRVFREYEHEFMSSENILIHHAHEDYDEICKLSGAQKLKYLLDKVTKYGKSIPVDRAVEAIIETAANEVLSKENIRRLCHEIDLRYDGERIGTIYSGSHNCYFFLTVKCIKEALAKATVDKITDSLGSEICKGILEYIKSQVEISIDETLCKIPLDLSEEIFATLKTAIIAIFITFFAPMLGVLYALVGLVTTFIWSVNVNSKEWRSKVADEVYKKVCEKREELLENVTPFVKEACNATKNDLEKLAEALVKVKDSIPLFDNQLLVKEWKQREVVNHRETLEYPKILTYVAGKKDNDVVVKVFLRCDDSNTETFFKTKCPLIKKEFVDVSKQCKLESHEKEAFSMEQATRKKLSSIIKIHGEKLMAKHSVIVSLGVGRIKTTDSTYGNPCIVLHCLDTILIPFGEEPLPAYIAGYPVDIRESFVLLGSCLNCTSFNTGCGIGRPSHSSVGSVGFLVKSNVSSSSTETGFLTAAHVALENFQDLYFRNALLSQDPLRNTSHEIVHPPCTNNVVGNVVESFCGNYGYGEEKIGMDAAFVKDKDARVGGFIVAHVANEEDLTWDGNMRVRKMGTTTKQTHGILVDASLAICVDIPSPRGGFYFFEECYGICDDKSEFFKEGDSGSGVYLIDRDERIKPLGIAFARLRSITAVCKISKILDAFNISVFQNADS